MEMTEMRRAGVSLASLRTSDAVVGLLLVLLVSFVYALTASYSLAQNNDSRAAAVGAWSVATRGTTVLPEEWPVEHISWPVVGDDGAVRVNRFPGVIYWAVPFYYVADVLAGGNTSDVPHPYLLDYRPAAVAAIVAATLAVLVIYLVFLRLVNRRIAFWSALFVALGTSTWSISGNALWTHGLTQLLLALAVLAMASDRPVVAGAAHGLSIVVRPQTAMTALVMGAGRAIQRRSVGDLLRVGLPSAVGLLAVAAYSWINFANPLPTSGYNPYAVTNLADPSAYRLLTGVWGTLFDLRRGLVIHAPFLVVLIAGLRKAWKVAPRWVRSAALAGLAYQLFQLLLNEFSGGTFFFSYRLPLEMLTLAAPLLLLSFIHTVLGSRLRELVFVIGASMAVGLQLVAVTSLSVATLVRPSLEPRVAEVCAAAETFECTVGELLPR
jgi:hypothetical protein